MDPITQWRQRLVRKASLLVLSDDQRVDDPFCTWFGRVTLGMPGEPWPMANGRLMWPLLQIVVRELPFLPAALDGLALMRVFVDPAFLGDEDEGRVDFHEVEGVSGPGWLLLASPALDGFEKVTEPDHGSRIRPAPGRWELIEADYPTFDYLPEDLRDSLTHEHCESDLETHEGTKVGGWPFTIQSEVCLGPMGQNPLDPEYAFQIGSDHDRGWMWGDDGFAYFGRGTGECRDEWAMDWQCC